MTEFLTMVTSLPQEQRQEAAQELHQRILRNAEQAVCAIYDLGQNLSMMNETKLYTELGYQSLEDYTEKEFGFRQRQAYTYISIYEKLGRSFLQSNAKLGVTKLSLLTEVSGFDREDFLAEHDVEGMSVKELEELIRKGQEQAEQISFLQKEVAAKAKETDGQLAQKRKYEKELEELRSKLFSSEQDKAHAKKTSEDTKVWYEKACEERDEALTKVRELENRSADAVPAEPDADTAAQWIAQAKQEFEQEKQAAITAAVEEQMRNAEQSLSEQLEQVRETARKEADEQLQASLDSMQAEKLAAEKRAGALAKQLEVSTDKDFLEASFYFDSVKEGFGKLFGVLLRMREASPDKAAKLAAGIQKVLAALVSSLSDIRGE